MNNAEQLENSFKLKCIKSKCFYWDVGSIYEAKKTTSFSENGEVLVSDCEGNHQRWHAYTDDGTVYEIALDDLIIFEVVKNDA